MQRRGFCEVGLGLVPAAKRGVSGPTVIPMLTSSGRADDPRIVLGGPGPVPRRGVRPAAGSPEPGILILQLDGAVQVGDGQVGPIEPELSPAAGGPEYTGVPIQVDGPGEGGNGLGVLAHHLAHDRVPSRPGHCSAALRNPSTVRDGLVPLQEFLVGVRTRRQQRHAVLPNLQGSGQVSTARAPFPQVGIRPGPRLPDRRLVALHLEGTAEVRDGEVQCRSRS
jgi:hypothetical protein